MRNAALLLIGLGLLARGATAQIYGAAERGDWSQVKELLQAQPKLINEPNAGHTGETLLQIACEKGTADIVGYLIEKGANVNAADKYGVTPLLTAVDAQTNAIVGVLIARGADVNLANRYGIAPLHLATKGSAAIVDLLLAGGAMINKTTSTQFPGIAQEDVPDQFAGGDTPLLCAARAGNLPVAERLISKGADVNIGDKKGLTPLHISVLNGGDQLVVLLLKNKANVNAKTRGGTTPLNLAIEAGNDGLADYLRKNGAKEGSLLREEDAPTECR
jgi:ankyrin repeat protein